MPGKPGPQELTAIVVGNADVSVAAYDDPANPTELHIWTNNPTTPRKLSLPAQTNGLFLKVHSTKEIRPLIVTDPHLPPMNVHQICQNEPVRLGTQIQPQGANWLGTGGCPVRWADGQGDPCYGILSNWHVMHGGQCAGGCPQHQPTTTRAAIGLLEDWTVVDASTANKVDGAIANALVDGFHTISDEVIGIGLIGDHTIDAAVGLSVSKSGRTTGLTHGHCVAVGASVQVGYGGFNAVFEDQDVYAGSEGTFSAPGDSGSQIFGRTCRCPCSLLFAGSTELTIGNPMRHVNEAFGLRWPFN